MNKKPNYKTAAILLYLAAVCFGIMGIIDLCNKDYLAGGLMTLAAVLDLISGTLNLINYKKNN